MTALPPSVRLDLRGAPRRAGPGVLVPLVSGGSMVYSQLLSAGFGVFLAAFLGADAFGSMNLARNILTGAIFLTPLGLDLALQRHLGERGAADADCAELFWLRLAPLALSGAIALAMLLGGGAAVEAHLVRHEGFGAVLAVTVLALPFFTDLTVLGGAYRGRYRPVPSVVASFLIQPTLRVAAVLALCLWTTRLWAAVDGTLLSFAAAWVFIAWRARRDFPLRAAALRGALPSALAVLRYAPVLGLSTFLFAMAKTLDLTALGLVDDLAEVGRYSVVVMMCQLVGTVGNALGQTIGTSVASAAKAGDRPRLVALLSENMELSAILAAPFCVAVAAWGSDVDLLLGPNYATAPLVFVVAATSQWVFTVAHNCSAALSMTGRHKLELVNNALALALEVAGCALLIPRFGMVGAALATAIMVVGLNGLRQVQIGRMLGDPLLRWRFLAPLALSAVLAVPLLWLGHALGFRAWWLTGLLAGTHVAASFAAMLTLLATPEQRRRLLAPLARFRRG
jgi:O-antigen/teichoic acid export membrane protein